MKKLAIAWLACVGIAGAQQPEEPTSDPSPFAEAVVQLEALVAEADALVAKGDLPAARAVCQRALASAKLDHA